MPRVLWIGTGLLRGPWKELEALASCLGAQWEQAYTASSFRNVSASFVHNEAQHATPLLGSNELHRGHLATIKRTRVVWPSVEAPIARSNLGTKIRPDHFGVARFWILQHTTLRWRDIFTTGRPMISFTEPTLNLLTFGCGFFRPKLFNQCKLCSCVFLRMALSISPTRNTNLAGKIPNEISGVKVNLGTITFTLST